MKEFKIRASAGGKLLTAKGAVSKAQTPRSYQEEWLISEITGKKKEIDSKYLRRGIEMEAAAIKRVGSNLVKNEESFEDEYFTGTPDVITEDTVIDTKCSWNCFTFPYFMKEPPIGYIAQLQIYMHLTGRKKAKLAYCLENGTMEQINKLAWSKAKEEGRDEPTIENWDEAEKDLNYDHLPEHLRIKAFELEYDQAMVDNIIEGVILGRKYVSELLTTIKL